MSNSNYTCPKCSSKNLTAKYESAYVYSYKIDHSNQPDTEEYAAPFLFEDRQLKYSKDYIKCDDCNYQYETSFKLKSNKVEI